MFARLAAISGAGAAPTDGVSFFRDHVLPDLRGYDGFHDAMVLLPREGGDLLVLSLWDTEENLRRAEATAAPHRTSAARAALGPETQRDVRIYEVVADACK